MTAPPHEMILASAGSGKTYALTNRFVRLLAGGARPERIIALTFTRKAAGEFFDEILRKLAGAAGDEARAAALAREVGRPELGPADFLRLLRGVTDAMPRLRLGTLDSFFARIARAFPLELGLAGEFEVLHEHAARLERRRVLRRMFARAGALDDAQRAFIEAFKRATFGREEKRLGAQLDAFLDEHHEVYLMAPEAEAWGDPARIWPAGQPWLDGRADPARAVRQLHAWLATAAPADKQRQRWTDFLETFEAWVPGSNVTGPLAYVLAKALAAWAELKAGATTLQFDRRDQDLDAPAAAALAEIARLVAGGELARRLEMTQGKFAVLRGYEDHYHDAVRRAGRLTFADVQRLLAPGAGAPALSRETAEGRLFIDYRLDAEIDHWLLDEFQDTSFGQWSVLKNLIDEVVQDAESRRTFFCVGDVKQAIYTWRGGDPRLFREIHRHYTAAAPGAIATGHLDESWRSGPAVIAMVNEVFGDSAALEELFPGPMSATWNAEWRPHVSAVPDRAGQAAWLLADDEAGRREVVLALLRELRPLQRGLSCAVLVQTNRAAAELADFLRHAAGLPAVAESDLPVCTDNPLGAAVLALVQAAAHPGDTLAWGHLQMTPFAPVLAQEGIRDREGLTRRVLGQIHHDGFERTVAHWVSAVEARLAADDAFSRARGRQLVDAAREFDGTGGRAVAEFVAFMERHTIREPEGAAVVRVMTIHKAKGLGFDLVLLPDLEGTRLDEARNGLAVHRAADRSVEWVLDAPPRLFAQHDPVLAAHTREAEAEAGYEALSLLYVGLTRAKRGLYVVTGRPGASTSRNYPRLLQDTLGGADADREIVVGETRLRGAWVEGDAGWHLAVSPPAAAPVREFPGRIAATSAAMKRFPSLRPSAHGAGVFSSGLFSLQRATATDFGTLVHRLLAQVEWGPAPEVVRGWESLSEPAAREAAAVLRAPALHDVWSPPVGSKVEVWRERAFEMIWDEAWITGTMDRVVVECGRDGHPSRATVYDFKTDLVDETLLEPIARRYADQMRHYRQAVSRLTGLALDDVRGVLVLTKLLRVVEPAG